MVSLPGTLLELLNSAHPCREKHFFSLYSVLGNPRLASPPALLLTGGPSTGKSSIIRAFLETFAITYVWIDAAECFTSVLLFDRIVNGLREELGREVENRKRVRMGADLNVFVEGVRVALEGVEKKVVLVLDEADSINTIPVDTLIPTLVRLASLIPSSFLTLLFLYRSPPVRLLRADYIPTIHFPPYSKPALLVILSLRAPSSLYSSLPSNPPNPEGDLDQAQLTKIWEILCSVVIDTYGSSVGSNIAEIDHVARGLWEGFVEAVVQCGEIEDMDGRTERVFGQVSIQGLVAIARRKGLFQGEEAVLRDISFTPLQTESIKGTVRHDLPYYTKFLLIAGFLASYNPSKDDRRIFSKGSDIRKRKRRNNPARNNKGTAKISQRLLGPRPFDLERLLAIFHSLTNYEVPQTIDVHLQIAALGELGMLIRWGQAGKWRINVGEDEVRRIAGSVGLRLGDVLVD